LIPPDGPDNGDKRLVDVDPLFSRSLDALSVEPLGEIPALYRGVNGSF
jgi:hypothetical protein